MKKGITSIAKKLLLTKIKIIAVVVAAVVVLFFGIFACFTGAIYDDDRYDINWDSAQEREYAMYGNNGGFIAVGSGSAIFDNSYTEDDFVKAVNSFIPPNETYGPTGKTTKWGYETFFKPNAQNFFKIATSYGLDPRFILSIGIHESYYGTSNIALDKGNFFGWGAYDSSPYSSAFSFHDMSKGIDTVSKGLATTYIAENGTFHQSIVNKGYDPSTIEGIGSIYASDPNWANGVKSHMQEIFGSMTTSIPNNGQVGSGSVSSASGDGYSSIYTSSSGKKYKEYKQNSGASYSGKPYGELTIAAQGCSVTSLAIVASGYGYDYNPGHWAGGIISVHGEAQSYAPKSTLTHTSSEGSYASFNVPKQHKEAIQNHLKTGNAVIVHLLKGNEYVHRQHWVALLDISADGSKVYVSNPNVGGPNGWDSIDNVLKALCCYIRISK